MLLDGLMRFFRTLLSGKQALVDPENLGRELYMALLDPEIIGPIMRVCKLDDTLQGRFAALSLFAAVVFERTRIGLSGLDLGTSALSNLLSQIENAYSQNRTQEIWKLERGLVDAMVQDIDIIFRESSLGDATVKKHAINHAAALYGRLHAYKTMLGGQTKSVKSVLLRNLYGDKPTQAQIAALPNILSELKGLMENLP